MSLCSRRAQDIQEVKIVAGDHGTPLRFAVRDHTRPAPGHALDQRNPSTWRPVDLARVAAVRVNVRPDGQSGPVRELIAMKLKPLDGGMCQLVWPPEFFAVAGRYEGEVSLEYDGKSVETVYLRLIFVVRERF